MPGDTDLDREVVTSIKELFILGTHGHKKLQDSAGSVLATSAVAVSCGFILLSCLSSKIGRLFYPHSLWKD